MTSKIKCPLCQQELRQDYTGVMYCGNEDCEQSADWYGSQILWKALIESHKSLVLSEQSADREIHRLRGLLSQSQKDLEIATKALEEIDTTRCIPQQTLISLGKFSKITRFNAGNIICVATPDYIHNTLEQIEHKE